MIEVRLFAGAREAIGKEYVQVVADPVFTAADLKEGIARMYPDVALLVRASRIAVGNSFVADGDRLESAFETGKTIALIPPVSGG
jgi:molybdopterin converting factor small subunit